jgi:hypothetical protein
MDTLVRLNADELNVALIDFIKSSFKGKKIAVHIYEDETDETEFVLRDPVARERILKAVENVNQNRNMKEYTMEEINSFLNEPNP